MSQTNILAAGTGAAETIAFSVTGPVLIAAFGTLGADTGNLQRRATDGTWVDVYSSDALVQLKAAQPQVIIDGPGIYKVVFAARTAAIGVDKEPFPA